GKIALAAESRYVDLCIGDKFIHSFNVGEKDYFEFTGLSGESEEIHLWLPHIGHLDFYHLELDEGAILEVYEDKRPRWVTYGSSITQCGAARSTAFTWPAIVARHFSLNLTCLGFSGQCH